jgi:hypothetical protein
MHYHGFLEYGSGPGHIFFNYSQAKLVDELVLPFVNGQIVPLRSGKSEKLFNMKNATFLRIYCTPEKLAATADKSVGQQIQDPAFQTNDCTASLLKSVKQSARSSPTTSLLQKALQPLKPQVFVIMKFGDDVLDSAYNSIYKPAIKRRGLSCLRIDEIPDSGKISDQILEAIAESKYIIADLSGARPNCYYEAGFAHALGKEIILVIREGEAAHFDLQGHRFIQWKTESDLKKKINARLKMLEESNAKASPVQPTP